MDIFSHLYHVICVTFSYLFLVLHCLSFFIRFLFLLVYLDHGQPQKQFSGAVPALHSKRVVALRAVLCNPADLLRHFLAPFVRVHQRAGAQVKQTSPN